MIQHGVAVIGTGFIGPVHVEALRRAGQLVVGILGSSAEKSRTAAEQLTIPTAYDSFDALLADERVEVVHIASPNRQHFDQAARALSAGKHVMCEKPLAMTAEQSKLLVRLAQESGRAAGVCYNVRFYPLCHEAADRVRSGQIGSIYHVTGAYVQDWLLHDTDFNWRVLADDAGPLRAVADIGTHWLDLIQFIVGAKVKTVCAELKTVHTTRQRPIGGIETFAGPQSTPTPRTPVAVTTDDYGCVMLRFENGAVGNVVVSQVTAGRKNAIRFELAGSKAALAWESERPNELWIGHRDRANESLIRDPSLLGESARGISTYPGGHNEGFPDSFKHLFCCFYQAIDDGSYVTAPAFPTFADGHQEMVLCDAILRSHRERRWVELYEVDPAS